MMMKSLSLCRRNGGAFALAGLCFAMAGCAPAVTRPADLDQLVGPAAAEAPATPYRIDIGDTVEVKFFFVPELNDVVQVRPDGHISVMFAEDVKAAGKTPEQLAEKIKEKLGGQIKQKDLVVVVRSSAKQKAYVGGEVGRSGSVPLSGSPTLLQVLTEAGWITPLARDEEIVLVRRDEEEGEEKVYPINLRKILSGEDMSQNVTVLAGDQIFVPPSDVTVFNRWVDQHIRQALPFSTSASATYTNERND